MLAARLKAAMEGWGSDGSALVRILAGVDGAQLAAVSAAYQAKYAVPLASALRKVRARARVTLTLSPTLTLTLTLT